jgi:hypothetical protein
MKTFNRIPALVLALTMGTGAVTAPIAASADGRGDRTAAIGLGAAAAALLMTQHNKTPGLIAAGAALYELNQSQRDDCNRPGWDGDHTAFVRTGYGDRDHDYRNGDRDRRDNDRRDNDRRDGGQRNDARHDRR